MPAEQFLKAIRKSPDSPYRWIQVAHHRQQEKRHELALARQRAWELDRQLAHAAIENERRRKYLDKQELLGFIDNCDRRRWLYPENSLLLGTVRGHPMEGLDLKIADHLHDEYHHHRHLTDLPIWYTGSEMGLTFGATGAGKFTAMVANNVMLFNDSVFVIDPKGEVCSVTAEARRKKFQKVYRLDPFNVTEFKPGAYQPPAVSYNPLDALDPNEIDFEDDVASLVEILSTPSEGGDSARYFTDQAKILLVALIMFVLTSRHFEGQRNFATVYDCLCSEPLKMEWLLKEMALDKIDTIRLCGTAHQGMAEKTRSGIWTQAQTDTVIFNRPAIRNVTSHSSFRMDELFEGECTVYLVLDNNRLDSHNRFLRLMMEVSLMVAVRHKISRQGRRMLWIVDEARQLGGLKAIPRAYRLLRGYGVQVWSFWQSLQDIQTTYPQDWESMIENSFVQLLRCNSLNTAKYFSELGGEYKEKKDSHGVTRGKSWTDSSSFTVGSHGSGGISRGPSGSTVSSSSGGSSSRTTGSSETVSYSETTTRSWQWEKRIRLDHIFTMSQDKMYLRCPGERAGFIQKHHYHADQKLKALANDNPFYSGPPQEPIFQNPSLGRVEESGD